MDTHVLTESLVLADAPDDGLTRRFYEILFERYPQVRPMFGADIGPQAAMLRTAVVAVLEHLEDETWLTETLGTLGARHAAWGVTEPMYAAVAECMLAALSELAGDAWTPAMTEAWAEALTAVAGLMLAGYPAEEVAS
jgi:hemoglobin-like flavoprotein